MSVHINKTVLITGASGVLGRQVANRFTNAGWNVTGLAYSRANKNHLVRCDLTNFDETDAIIRDVKPDAIVHCAAERKPDEYEKNAEKAMFLNVDVTRHLAELAARENIFFILISTDYVFDGKKPPYKEDDTPNPLQAYGKSKYEAELVTQKISQNHVILRVPLLYGEVENLEENAVTILFKNIKNPTARVKMDDVQTRYPTYIGDVAEVCLQLCELRIKQNRNDVRGIFHFSGIAKYTKYQLALVIASLFQLPIDHIERDQGTGTNTNVQRPENAALDSSKLSDQLGININRANFETTIKRCLESFI
ncbi:unnamed protein product [Rotaria socialis]|uniref:Methionine adenosyltransferase 2 subunit beta n=1 Tax=Rotaria socialis TaxID=392032 RepID=A0A817XZN5_9BILA|nr:unnamed protein product [Rotaria socialis]CAF3332354.1 unnamed protein product [Rotaria socialis]CAF3374231.1 unnamed protein product [Rotaria socialis]CAF3577813.1 unnamed protein product [Rotaria socialis]CAF3760165.1 unnamed protein product [Rotaria socialis]